MTTSPKGRGMGRGLGALGLSGPVMAVPVSEAQSDSPVELGEFAPTANGTATPEQEARKAGLIMVPITSIAPNPYQPRKHIDPDILAELAQSIRENGLIQPPVVSYNPDFDPDYKEGEVVEEAATEVRKERSARYLLIAGERRWQASKLAGLTNIPVVLKEASPLQMLELALVENIQRADLNPLEEAQAYKQLMQEFKLTQESVAQKVGKSRAAVANALRLFDLPQEILDAVYKNFITEGHARALLMVREKTDQYRLLKDIIAKQYSVRQTEEMARRLNAEAATVGLFPDQEKPKLSPAERETRELEQQFREALKTKVALSRSNKGGKLVIEFYSDEELEAIYNKIVGPEI
jgi:ParB family transcriptional regulator, chromosome partitioning protein